MFKNVITMLNPRLFPISNLRSGIVGVGDLWKGEVLLKDTTVVGHGGNGLVMSSRLHRASSTVNIYNGRMYGRGALKGILSKWTGNNGCLLDLWDEKEGDDRNRGVVVDAKLPLLCAALALKSVEKEEEEDSDDFEEPEEPEKGLEMKTLEPDLILESPCKTCNFCGSCLAVDKKSMTKKALMSVYTRDGTKFARHLIKRCQNNGCRAGHFLGYTVKNKVRRYDSDVLQTSKYLGN